MPNIQTTDLLDRALKDLSAEQRARVLDLVIRLDIDRDDPLWLIAIAIGQLQVLVQDAPEEWQDVFMSFREELQAWSETNLRALEAIARQAENGESLAKTVNELTNLFATLAKALIAQGDSSSKPGQQWSRLESRLEDWKNSLNVRIERFTAENSKILEFERSMKLTSKNTVSPILNLSVSVLLALGVGLGFWTLWQGQQQQSKRLEWLLQKATRQECISGIKDFSSRECQGVK